MTKEKLTLGVNKDVIKRAREVGINISELTERVLSGFTFEPSKIDEEELRAKYIELFETMRPVQKKLNVSTVVGKDEIYDDVSEFPVPI